MPSYNAPGVYIHDVVSGIQSITLASSSVGILFGQTNNGIVNFPKKIGSWTEFVAEFANGLDTPFLENSYLPYSVYGFFTNGGRELYVVNVRKGAVKATLTSTDNTIKVTALNEGVWGNQIKVDIKKAYDYSVDNKVFDVTISIGDSDSITISDVTLENIESQVMSSSKVKSWIGEFTLTTSIDELEEETFTLENGSDGSALQDSDYISAFSLMDTLDDVTLVGVPGQTSSAITDALLTYCDNNGLFPIIDMPIGSTAEQTKTFRKSISAWTGALAHPWGKINDPLTNNLKTVPTCGHLMGVYARTIESRGVQKAPAGVDAVVRGFIEMEYTLTTAQISTLNPIGVICIVAKPNAGIVSWGARSLNSTDTTMRYVTDGLLNLAIKKSLYEGTQFAVFEPNDENLWSKVRATCKAFLEELRLNGALKGTAEEAYYVTVDSSNNTDATIAEGQLNIEIGYSPIKPAEFVIIKLAHSIQV